MRSAVARGADKKLGWARVLCEKLVCQLVGPDFSTENPSPVSAVSELYSRTRSRKALWYVAIKGKPNPV